ncbi:hypothetical protein [Xenorhabdus bovienii]|uniref:hypothetical protein n=1 Tax=Xenorhabdus bovienii TaxID=40576 RepID=UPI0023B2C278|nr:hypothetical protein [Xenorhabdus bovienii]MDE9463490.1 hypothetical protein [Xenorhabdus bovienii]MDE9471023.1 hypothetical protein [Xenorhabdus bovienii]
MRTITLKVHYQKEAHPFICYVEGETIIDELKEIEEFMLSSPELKMEGDYLFTFSFKYEDGAPDNGWEYELIAFYPMDEDGKVSETPLM